MAVSFNKAKTDLSIVKISVGSTRKNYNMTQLTPAERRKQCGRFPLLFERASRKWWNPSFDSKTLENQYWKSSFSQTRRRFQYVLFYIITACVAWCIFFGVNMKPYWYAFVSGSCVLIVFSICMLVFTFSQLYQKFYLLASFTVTIVLCALSLSIYYYIAEKIPNLSSVSTFSISLEILLMTYTVIPMPLPACVITGGIYSIAFEVLAGVRTNDSSTHHVISKVLLHLCIHFIGIHIFVMSQVRLRSTFWKVGQSIMTRQDLEIEKQLKEKMIHSVMPPKVADELLRSENNDIFDCGAKRKSSSKKKGVAPSRGEIVFRPFNMHRMENVSILFADIVGFTKMSSNKTAEQLVGLLNNLFGRFDKLCAKNGCEKISTLGDCYYCVAGCPEPKPGNARCCVQMGLDMIVAIKEFDEDTNEDVNMRVGVHTGAILCGIVGTKRFKFDVWSNDVTYANLMESTGKPGRVHISETTYKILNDEYAVEEAESRDGLKTYFISCPKKNLHTTKSNSISGLVLSADHSPVISHDPSYIHSSGDDLRPEIKVTKPGSYTPPMPKDMHSAPVSRKTSPGSMGSHINGRKDTTTSRRGSLRSQVVSNHIDVQLMDANGMTAATLLTRRSSGYYASSHSSAVDLMSEHPNNQSELRNTYVDPNFTPLAESVSRAHHMQEQNDKQLVNCMRDDTGYEDYFENPPISKISLTFLDSNLEHEYREHFREREGKSAPRILSSPQYTTFFDVFVSFIVFILISIVCFIVFDRPPAWTIFFTFSLLLELVIVIAVVRHAFAEKNISPCFGNLMHTLSGWYSRHFIGAIMNILPAVAIFANFSCYSFGRDESICHFFCYTLFVSLLHLCNFVQLNFWMKTLLAFTIEVILLFLLSLGVCPHSLSNNGTENANNQSKINPGLFTGDHSMRYEIILVMILMLFLACFLNREFEIIYRLSFHGDIEARNDKEKIQNLKDQADWLLHNIIPEHVAEQLKVASKYSENHKDVGVIFASIVNFNEMFDESFEGGKEYLRVLNELVGDFDELLDKPEYKNVEKIKTIGSTFMAASGLNPSIRKTCRHPYEHLYELMDFALNMHKVIDEFNRDLLEFNFIIRIGYNFGDITAGVIGTTKLYYDIWGDTVNIASRMDSTGMSNRIQVSEECATVLGKYFEFEYRAQIYVKGKDNMNVYLLVKKKDGVDYRNELLNSEETSSKTSVLIEPIITIEPN